MKCIFIKKPVTKKEKIKNNNQVFWHTITDKNNNFIGCKVDDICCLIF